jgi:predicted membrane-bound spermidine synthase
MTFGVGASVSQVCKYCRHVVLRTDRDLQNMGKVADLALTPSPVAVGDQGTIEGASIMILGRVQLDHGAGPWDEWYIAFSNGNWGWLAYAQGNWYVTSEVPDSASMVPPYEHLSVEQDIPLGQGNFRVIEVKRGTVVSGEGELPFQVTGGQERYYADLAGHNAGFATLDYGDRSGPPTVFIGRQVPEGALQIKAMGERPVTDVNTDALVCPSCGGRVPALAPNRSERLGCPYCGAVSEIAGRKVIEQQSAARARPDIPLGSAGQLLGQPYVVCGYVERSATIEGDYFSWQEYLLYGAGLGFRWLVKDESTWLFITPLNIAEIDLRGLPRNASWEGRSFHLRNHNSARVDYVLGEFYWKVRIGETVDAMDFLSGSDVLSRERMGDEVAWSIGNPVPWATIASAFGLPNDGVGATFSAPEGSSFVTPDGELSSQTVTIVVVLIIAVIILLVLCGACDDCGGGGSGGGIFFGGGSSRGGKLRAMGDRAAFALLATTLPYALWHLVLYRRAAAYLLLDLAASGQRVALVHLVCLVAGGLLAWRERQTPPWRLPLLIWLWGIGAAAWLLGGFLAFSSAPAFVLTVYGCALVLGLVGGALVVTLVRALGALEFRREGLLELLEAPRLAVGLAGGVAYLLAAERVGPLRTGMALCLAVTLVAHRGLTLLAPAARASRRLRRVVAGSCFLLAAGQLAVEPFSPWYEGGKTPDPVVLARNSETSRAILTSGRGAFQLYVDGMLRLSTIDAPRRNEAAVHPAMLAAARRGRVLLVGGGDGGALQEILRYPDVDSVTLVEPEGFLLDFIGQPVLDHENGGAFTSPKVHPLRADPLTYLGGDAGLFDVIVLDLLEPEGPRRSKWFTRYFYEQVSLHLAPGGAGAVVTGASPFSQRQAYWCILRTLEAAGLRAVPYRVDVPTLGVWGLVLFGHETPVPKGILPPGLRYLDERVLPQLFQLSADEGPVEVEPNLLYHQVLLRYRLPT